jgi:hypothetical protein
LTETHQNLKARERRNGAWQAAFAGTNYWKARMGMHSAIYSVQDKGLPEGRIDPEVDFSEWSYLVAKYRAALAEQLLIPAPRLDAVEWKRKKLAAGEYTYTGVTRELLTWSFWRRIRSVERGRSVEHEAPAQIPPNPQPAAARGACPPAAAVTKRPAGSRWRASGLPPTGLSLEGLTGTSRKLHLI